MTAHVAEQEVALLREELEILMRERDALLCVAGAAAGFVANMEAQDLPRFAYEAADLLAQALNRIPEDTLQDALAAVGAKVTLDGPERRSRHRP
jgi:hypothetical protein